MRWSEIGTGRRLRFAAIAAFVAVSATIGFVAFRRAPASSPAGPAARSSGPPPPGGASPGAPPSGQQPGGQQPGGGRPPPGVFGTIVAIDGPVLTLTDSRGITTTVATSASTVVTRSSAGEVTDIQSGDRVRVLGPATSGTIEAVEINDSGQADVARGGAPRGGGRGGFGAGPSRRWTARS